MNNYSSMISAAAISFLLSRIAIPVIRRIAIVNGFVDRPDQRRKFQETPIPLGGGIAVWLAMWSGWGLSRSYEAWILGDQVQWAWPATALALASFLALALGFVDDRFGMRGMTKLVGQVIAASILVASGVRIGGFGCFGLEFGLGGLAVPITFFWIVLVVNAFNLIDGMDGFCASLSLVALLAISLISIGSGRLEDALLSLALAGGLAGFLMDNLPPARIYLGDAGSMSVGMVIAFLTIRASSDGPGSVVSLPLLLALLILPLLDVAVALVRRWLSGHSLFAPDRGHIHHCLRSRLRGNGAALGVGVLLATLAASGAVLQRAWDLGDLTASLFIVAAVIPLVRTGTFGDTELRLLMFRIRSTLKFLLIRGGIRGRVVRHQYHQLLGEGEWAGMWDALIREAESEGVCRIELSIEMPTAGESYHGRWALQGSMECRPSWSITHRLRVDGIDAGTLRVAGCVAESRPWHLDHVEVLVRAIEARLRPVAAHPTLSPTVGLPSAGVVHVR